MLHWIEGRIARGSKIETERERQRQRQRYHKSSETEKERQKETDIMRVTENDTDRVVYMLDVT